MGGPEPREEVARGVLSTSEKLKMVKQRKRPKKHLWLGLSQEDTWQVAIATTGPPREEDERY